MPIARLVVLDDDQQYLCLLEEFAKLVNIDFIGFSSPKPADFKNLRDDDLLLVDIYMPGIDGLDILMELSKADFKGNIAVMSGAVDNVIDSVAHLIKGLNLSFIGKLHKPIKLTDFQELLNTQLQELSDCSSNLTPATANIFAEIFKKDSIDEWFNKGYIYPVYQPQFCSKTKKVVGFECLTRVNHPKLGSLNPTQFIRLLDGAGWIQTYTLYFMDVVLNHIHPLLNANPNLRCSFNMSAMSLNIEFTNQLVSLLKSYQCKPEQVIVEITETSTVTLSIEAKYAISRLKVSGITLSIDDFGTGNSAIRQLVELPFDEIKIDRSFVIDLEDNHAYQAIITATMDLAKSLHYRLVVEGVENENQLRFLADKGKCIIQGFYLSEPVNFEQLAQFLDSYTVE